MKARPAENVKLASFPSTPKTERYGLRFTTYKAAPYDMDDTGAELAADHVLAVYAEKNLESHRLTSPLEVMAPRNSSWGPRYILYLKSLR